MLSVRARRGDALHHRSLVLPVATHTRFCFTGFPPPLIDSHATLAGQYPGCRNFSKIVESLVRQESSLNCRQRVACRWFSRDNAGPRAEAQLTSRAMRSEGYGRGEGARVLLKRGGARPWATHHQQGGGSTVEGFRSIHRSGVCGCRSRKRGRQFNFPTPPADPFSADPLSDGISATGQPWSRPAPWRRGPCSPRGWSGSETRDDAARRWSAIARGAGAARPAAGYDRPRGC